MSQYKNLSLEELKYLEKDFIHFLAANGITADHWEKLILDNDQKVNEILDDFTRFIHQIVLEKTEILEKRTTDSLTIFYSYLDRIFFIRIENNLPGIFDLGKEFTLENFQNYLQVNISNISVFRGEKSIKDNKATEFYYLLKSACKISQNIALLEILKKLIS
jgi:hypothetical protein